MPLRAQSTKRRVKKMAVSTDADVARFFGSMGVSPPGITILYRGHRVKAHARIGNHYGNLKLDVYGETTLSYKDGRRGMYCKDFSRAGLEMRLDDWIDSGAWRLRSGPETPGEFQPRGQKRERVVNESVDRMWQRAAFESNEQLCQFPCPSCGESMQAMLKEEQSTVACGACSNVFEVQKPQLSSASVGPTRQEILWQTMHVKPARNGASWSADEDREVWDVLGQFPRTASGGLSTANGVGRLVRQLATKYQRTEGAIKSRIQHHDTARLVATATGSFNSPSIGAASYTSPLTGRDATRSSAGWQSWPKPREGDYGLVYVVPSGAFGYYDDDEDRNECIVYLGKPMCGPAYMYRRHELRKPPFEGDYAAY